MKNIILHSLPYNSADNYSSELSIYQNILNDHDCYVHYFNWDLLFDNLRLEFIGEELIYENDPYNGCFLLLLNYKAIYHKDIYAYRIVKNYLWAFPPKRNFFDLEEINDYMLYYAYKTENLLNLFFNEIDLSQTLFILLPKDNLFTPLFSQKIKEKKLSVFLMVESFKDRKEANCFLEKNQFIDGCIYGNAKSALLSFRNLLLQRESTDNIRTIVYQKRNSINKVKNGPCQLDEQSTFSEQTTFNLLTAFLLQLKFAITQKTKIDGLEWLRKIVVDIESLMLFIDSLYYQRFFIGKDDLDYKKYVEERIHESNICLTHYPELSFHLIKNIIVKMERNIIETKPYYKLICIENKIIYKELINGLLIKELEFNEDSLEWFILTITNQEMLTFNEVMCLCERKYMDDLLDIEVYNSITTLNQEGLLYVTDKYKQIISIIDTNKNTGDTENLIE